MDFVAFFEGLSENPVFGGMLAAGLIGALRMIEAFVEGTPASAQQELAYVREAFGLPIAQAKLQNILLRRISNA